MGISSGGGETLKAWVNFNGTGTVAIRDSFNVSSITDIATGVYDINFDVDFAGVERAVVASCGRNGGSGGYLCNVDDGQAVSASETRVACFDTGGSSGDSATVSVMAIGLQ